VLEFRFRVFPVLTFPRYALAPKLVIRETSNQGSQGGEAATGTSEDLQLREKMFSIDRKMHALQQVICDRLPSHWHQHHHCNASAAAASSAACETRNICASEEQGRICDQGQPADHAFIIIIIISSSNSSNSNSSNSSNTI
jgi:hypothetical protein